MTTIYKYLVVFAILFSTLFGAYSWHKSEMKDDNRGTP